MSDKKLTMVVSFLIIIAGIALTALLPEELILHVPFQLMIIAVILLSVHMNARDIIILLLITSIVVWGISLYYEVLKNTMPLALETVVLFASCLILALYETNFKEEKHKLNVVSNYKKKESEILRAEIQAMTAENHKITESIKEFKKYFSQ